MMKKIWEWFTKERVIPEEYVPVLVEFDPKKDYIISLPDCDPKTLIAFKNAWKKEMKKKRPHHLFINKPIMIMEAKE